jgi:hypothetical protein
VTAARRPAPKVGYRRAPAPVEAAWTVLLNEPLAPPKPAAVRVLEAAWQRRVMAYARKLGWLVCHTRHSSGNTPGVPDLVLAHPAQGRVVFAELKRDGEAPRPGYWIGQGAARRYVSGQLGWIKALLGARQEAYWWCPADWPQVKRILATGPTGDMPCVARLRSLLLRAELGVR